MDLKSPQGYSPFRFHSSPTLGTSCRRFLEITSEMTQNNKTHIQETDTTMARGKIITAQASSRFILYSPPGQNSRLYDQTCSVQRMCINVIVQQKGVKFRPTAESVQSPYHKKGMFPYLQGTINLKAVSIFLAEHLVCKQYISTFSLLWPR